MKKIRAIYTGVTNPRFEHGKEYTINVYSGTTGGVWIGDVEADFAVAPTKYTDVQHFLNNWDHIRTQV